MVSLIKAQTGPGFVEVKRICMKDLVNGGQSLPANMLNVRKRRNQDLRIDHWSMMNNNLIG